MHVQKLIGFFIKERDLTYQDKHYVEGIFLVNEARVLCRMPKCLYNFNSTDLIQIDTYLVTELDSDRKLCTFLKVLTLTRYNKNIPEFQTYRVDGLLRKTSELKTRGTRGEVILRFIVAYVDAYKNKITVHCCADNDLAVELASLEGRWFVTLDGILDVKSKAIQLNCKNLIRKSEERKTVIPSNG